MFFISWNLVKFALIRLLFYILFVLIFFVINIYENFCKFQKVLDVFQEDIFVEVFRKEVDCYCEYFIENVFY